MSNNWSSVGSRMIKKQTLYIYNMLSVYYKGQETRLQRHNKQIVKSQPKFDRKKDGFTREEQDSPTKRMWKTQAQLWQLLYLPSPPLFFFIIIIIIFIITLLTVISNHIILSTFDSFKSNLLRSHQSQYYYRRNTLNCEVLIKKNFVFFKGGILDILTKNCEIKRG
jgi:hypothetical protein